MFLFPIICLILILQYEKTFKKDVLTSKELKYISIFF